MMPNADTNSLNERLRPLGYEVVEINSQYFISRLDESDWMRVCVDLASTERLVDHLESAPEWRLDLHHGNVDVDRETGVVTPRDGSTAFSVRDADGWSGNRPMNDMVLNADCLHIYREKKPPYGGAWHKWGGI